VAKAKPAPPPPPPPPAPPSAPSTATNEGELDRQLTPAEAMSGLTGKQLEAFQMVMSRMERLERENQELMQILIQMQGLLQQQTQRNDQLSAMAGQGQGLPGGMGASNTARLALEAQRQAMLARSQAPPTPPPPVRHILPGQAPLTPFAPPGPVTALDGKRKAETLEADDVEADAADDAEAPWKRQRRRVRRGAGETSAGESGAAPAPVQAPAAPPAPVPPALPAPSVPPAVPAGENVGQAAADAPDTGAGPGLAAYHAALLGV